MTSHLAARLHCVLFDWVLNLFVYGTLENVDVLLDNHFIFIRAIGTLKTQKCLVA